MNEPTARTLKARIDRLPVSADYGSRTARRRQVVALYVGYALIIPIYAVGYESLAGHGRTNPLVGVVSLGAMLASFTLFAYGFYSLLQNTLVNAPNIRDERLDERWIAQRNRAALTSMRALGIALALAAVYGEVAFTASRWTWLRDPYLISWFLWLGAILGMTLPTAILAWNEPNPLPEDSGGP